MSTSLSRSLLWLTLSEVLFNLSGYVIHSVVGRTLGPADYGRYGLVVTITTTVIILIGNGIPTALSRYLSEAFEAHPERVFVIRKTAIRLQVLLMGVVTFAFFLLSPFIAGILGDSTLAPLFRLSSLIIPSFAAASFYYYYFTGIHEFSTQAILKSFRSVARIVIIIGLTLVFGLSGSILGYILAPLSVFFLGLWFDAKSRSRFPKGSQEVFPWQELFAAAWPITLFLLFYEVFISIDLYLVKILLRNDEQTGLYNAALTLGRIPYYLFYALSIVLLPALAKLKSIGNHEEISRIMTNALRYSAIILVPIALLLAAYGSPIISLFFGQKFISAAASLQILSFGLSFLTVFYVVSSGLIGLGRAHLAMWLAILGTVLNVSLNVFLTPSFGILGAAWATTLSSIVVTVATLVIMQLFVKTPVRLGEFLKIALAGILLFLGTQVFQLTSPFFLLPATLLGVSYIVLLFFLRVLTREDFNAFAAVFLGKKKGSNDAR